jgi:hypothetical protein
MRLRDALLVAAAALVLGTLLPWWLAFLFAAVIVVAAFMVLGSRRLGRL